MLAKRVIPCMDVKDGRVVKGVNFVNLRDAGDPIELAQRYDEQRADEVIFLDITATSDDRATTVELASRASEQLHLPYCVGGGFRSVADIRKMIAAGADKVSVNSAAVANPQLITDAARAFGTQAILCAIDAKAVPGNPNKWEVYVAGGRKNTHIDAIEWAREAARRGAGEILLTSMDRDGSRDGRAPWPGPWTSPSSPAAAWASSSTSPRASSRARPTPCSPPASSTSASSPCAK